jgi:hypothetical protein
MSDGFKAGIGEEKRSRTIDLDQSRSVNGAPDPKRLRSDTMTPIPANSIETHSASKYDRLIAAAQAVPPTPTIVVHPCDETSLRGVVDSAAAGIIRPVLVGPEEKIRETASKYQLDISGFEIVDAPHSEAAAQRASSSSMPPRARC